jgi:hypothetical protein
MIYNQKLYDTGLSHIEKGQEKHDQPRLENTHRRSGQARQARKDALRQIIVGKMCVTCAQDQDLSKTFKTMKSVSDMVSILSNAVYQQSREDKSIGHDLRDINIGTFNYLKEELQTAQSKEFLGFLMDAISGNVPSEKEVKIELKKAMEQKLDEQIQILKNTQM